MAEDTITPRDVKEAVANGRVVAAPTFHAGRHGIGFADVLLALERCDRVEPDPRTDDHGEPVHPNGWIARSRAPFQRDLRVDLDAIWDDALRLFVVTAFHETP